jgi:hypothetical protein
MKDQVLFKWETHLITTIKKMGRGQLKIFFSRTTEPEELRFT